MTIARSIARPIAGPIASRTPIIGGGGGGGISPPFNQVFIVDDLGNFLVDDLGRRVTAYISHSITINVEDGASSPRDLVAADITYIGYWQIFDGVRATVGSVAFTPVNLASAGSSWVSGGIFSVGGVLRIDLPSHALVGDPDEIEIEITPASGTVVIPDPIVSV